MVHGRLVPRHLLRRLFRHPPAKHYCHGVFSKKYFAHFIKIETLLFDMLLWRGGKGKEQFRFFYLYKGDRSSNRVGKEFKNLFAWF